MKAFLESFYVLAVFAALALAWFSVSIFRHGFGPKEKRYNNVKLLFRSVPRVAGIVMLCMALILAPFIAGCSTAWVSTFDDILTAAAPALINILNIIAISKGEPINAPLEAKINADSATIKSLANDFAASSTNAAPTVCGQLQAAISTYSTDEQQVMALASVQNQATQEKIVVLSGLVAGTVTGLLAVIPNCQQAVQMKASLVKTAPPLPLKQFVGSYNATLSKPTGDKAVDKYTASHEIHVHGKFVRWLALGHAF